MNLPSGLVFYLDFKYGTNVDPFTSGGSLYGANASTNVTDIASASLYGGGRFGYSINQTSSIVTGTTGSVSWADVNFDSDYVATGSLVKVTWTVPGAYDANAVRSFALQGQIKSGSNAADVTATLVGNEALSNFTTLTGNTVTMIFQTSSLAATAAKFAVVLGSQTLLTASFSLTPQAQTGGNIGTNRGDFEDTAFNVGTPGISIPEINVQLKSEAIVAKTRKLKAQWTPEFAQDLNAYHSVDAEAELTGILSQYISMEIDLELLDMLIQNAFTTEYWSAINNTVYSAGAFNVPTTTSQTQFYNTQGGWFQTLGTKLQKVSNKIHQLTLRGGANFLVMSPTVATILESIPGFAADGDGEKMEYNFGIQKIGSLNSRYKVYKNPYMTENVILMGYKGAQFLECGAVFAPYVPLIMTPLLYDPSTFTPRKGLMTRYAKKMIRPDYYGKIYVSGLNTL